MMVLAFAVWVEPTWKAPPKIQNKTGSFFSSEMFDGRWMLRVRQSSPSGGGAGVDVAGAPVLTVLAII